jgi:protocatechuate 3,4-dioxygenase beta subunit
MIAVLPLAAVLAAALTAPDTQKVRLTGVVLAEKAVEFATVRVFAVGEAVVARPELARAPLHEVALAPGPFELEVDAGAFPLRVEISARGHLAAALERSEAKSGELPPLWLPAGSPVSLRVLAGGRPVTGAVVRGELDAARAVMVGSWRAVAPVRESDASGSVEIVAPATGELEVEALSGDGRWGTVVVQLPVSAPVRLELATRALTVAVRTPAGEPAAGVHVAVSGAPIGSVAITDAAGRARLQAAERGGSVVVALGDGCGARTVSYPGARAETALVCAPLTPLAMSWTGGGAELQAWPGWLPASLYGGAALVLRGGSASVPYFGHGGRLAAWSPGSAGQRAEVEDGAAGISLRFSAAAAIAGTVVDAAERPVAGVPVWGWTLPGFVLSPGFRGPRGADMLQRTVLPLGVSDARGRFTAAPLLPALTRLAAIKAGRPPARSAPLDLGPGAREEVTLTLEAGTWVAFSVQDPEGRALAGVAADLVPNPDARGPRMVIRMGGGDRRVTERVAQGATDREGRALLEGVPAGAMKLHLTLSGYVSRSVDVEVPQQGVDAGALVMEPGVTVLGRVVDEHGAGIADAEIRAGSMLGAFGPAVATSDAAGAFAVPDRPREGETYLVAERGENERSEPVRVALPPPGPVELVIRGRRELTGRVVDETTAAPVASAVVSAERTTRMQSGGGGMSFAFIMSDSSGDAETDGEGRFRLPGLAAGEYTLTARAASYRPLEQQVKVPESEAPRPVTLLLKPGLIIRGTVLDPTGRPAPGVVVEASPAARGGRGIAFRESAETARSGDDGAFTVAGLEPGQYVLAASAEDGATAREVVEAGAEEPVELRLEGGGAISGRVVSEDGSPVSGASVAGFGGSDVQLEPVPVDGSGAFTMLKVAPGQYRVWATAEGWAQAQGQAVVESGRTATVELTLKRGGTVNGRVLGLTAAEISRCQVFSRGARTQPAPDGSFTLAGVPLGRGEVGAFVLPESKRRTATVDVTAIDQPVSVELDFGHGARLFGGVRRSGAPLGSIIVEVSSGGGGQTTTSDSQGQWELAGVEPGRVEVRALDRQSRVLAARELDVTGDAHVDLEIQGGTVRGAVVALPDRAPLVGAKVTAEGGGEPPITRDAGTDQRGAFTLEDLPDGDLVVRADAEGYAPAEARVTVSMGVGREVVLALEAEKRLRLLLREEDGSAPDQVQLLPVRGGRVDDPVWVTCDRAGRASVASLPAGAYTFFISSGGGAALVTLPVPNVETAVALRATGTLRAATPVGEEWRVRVVSVESGLPVPVGPWQNPGRGDWVAVRGGVLALRVPAGTYLVQGIAPDGTTRERQVAVTSEGDALAALE